MTGTISAILPAPGDRKGSIVSDDGFTRCFGEADLIGVSFFDLQLGDAVEFTPGGDFNAHANNVKLATVRGELNQAGLIVGDGR